MRHGKKINHLSRTSSHRNALLANMACSLIERKRINTTLAKAKALRQYVEPILTKSKDDTTHSRRVVFGYLQNKEVVAELFRDVAPKIAKRPGGYTRILKTGNRLGDNAEMCFIELVDFNETYIQEGKEKKTTRRSRRGGKAAGTQTAAKEVTAIESNDSSAEVAAPAEELKSEAVAGTEKQAEAKIEGKEKKKTSKKDDKEPKA